MQEKRNKPQMDADIHGWKRVFIFLMVLFACGCFVSNDDVMKQRTIRIFSYNIRHGEGMDGRIDLKRIADVISAKNPDLVALQEIDKNCARSGNRDIASELGDMLGMDYRFGKFMDFQGGEYGMAVLSRFPIVETIRHSLPDGAEPRCALEIKVQIDDSTSPISFVCIHNDWINEGIRVKQVEALMAFLRDYNNPIILAGDFNGEKSDASLELLEQAGWKILDKNGKKTWPADNPEVEIDFFVTRGASFVTAEHDVIDERTASDHRPIYAVIGE